MSARAELAAALKAGLPGWLIVSTARPLDSVRKPGTCVLWTSKLSRNVRSTGHVGAEIVLWVLTASEAADVIEDDLDALLEKVSGVLEPLDAFLWTEAERGVLAEHFEGYRLTVNCNYKIDTEGA